MRLIFFVEFKCISVESASHFYSFVCRCVRSKNLHSQFDKFNHVKYTKSLSLRNWYTQIRLLFFAPNAPNAHKASFKVRFFRSSCADFFTLRAPRRRVFRAGFFRPARRRCDEICQPKNTLAVADFRTRSRQKNRRRARAFFDTRAARPTRTCAPPAVSNFYAHMY